MEILLGPTLHGVLLEPHLSARCDLVVEKLEASGLAQLRDVLVRAHVELPGVEEKRIHF